MSSLQHSRQLSHEPDLAWLIGPDQDQELTVIFKPANQPGVRIIDGQRYYSARWLDLLAELYAVERAEA